MFSHSLFFLQATFVKRWLCFVRYAYHKSKGLKSPTSQPTGIVSLMQGVIRAKRGFSVETKLNKKKQREHSIDYQRLMFVPRV
jgi:hypothetical protein